MTTRSMHKNDNKLYVDMRFSLVKDRTGGVMGSLAIGRDCTERQLVCGENGPLAFESPG